MHYHLGLVCTLCMDLFATGADTIWWHMYVCKSMATEGKDHKKEKESDK